MGSSETPAVASIENASGRSRKLRMVETRDSRSVSTPHFQGNEPTFVARFPEHLTRAPAHLRHRHLGRERPRWRPRGRLCERAGGVAHAPSLLRHLCWGAHRAAQTAARSNSGAGANIELVQGVASGSRSGVAHAGRGTSGSWAPSGRGANRALAHASPSSAPSAATT